MANRFRTSPQGAHTIVALLLAAVCALVPNRRAAAHENQTWLKFSGEHAPFANGCFLSVEQELKFNRDRMVDEETLMLVGYSFCPYFKAAIGHRIVRERKPDDRHFLTEQRQTTDLHFYAPEFLTLKFDFRSRFELRDKHHAQVHMRYRERLRLRTSWNVTAFKISPYLSEEFFLSDEPKADDADLFDRTRTAIGLTFKPIPSCENVSCNLYYLIQHDKEDSSSSSWCDTNVCGFELACSY